MSRKLYVPCVALLALGLMVGAGCGDDDNDNSGSSSPSTQSSSGGGGGNANPAAGDQAKQACESAIQGSPTLASDKKPALTDECKKLADAAASGDRGKFKSEYKTYCGKLADALPSQAQATAKQACLQGANSIK